MKKWQLQNATARTKKEIYNTEYIMLDNYNTDLVGKDHVQ